MPVTTRSQYKAGKLALTKGIRNDSRKASLRHTCSSCKDAKAGSVESGSDSDVDSVLSSNNENEDKAELHLDLLKATYAHTVDLIALEKQRNNAPVFSRTLLLQIRKQRQKILQETYLPYERRKVKHLAWRAPDGHLTNIWARTKPSQTGQKCKEHVRVEFVPRIALDPDFQRDFAGPAQVEAVIWLREYNHAITQAHGAKQLHFDAPYALKTVEQEEGYAHLDTELMQRYRDALVQSLAYWKEHSDLHHKFTKMIEGTAAISAPIKKIVCFGVGRVRPDYMYDSIFQHMAIFSMAQDLIKHYEAIGRKRRRIQIVLQDPCYEEADWTLFRELHQAMGCNPSTDLEFVQDPDDLLAIDSSTMVIAPHLPTTFPWSQIIADLFASGSGPAVIIGDCPVTDRRQFGKKTTFTFRDRGSPAVAKFLSDRYVVFQEGLWSGGDGTLLALGIDEYSPFSIDWLPDMDIYVRKEDDALTD